MSDETLVVTLTKVQDATTSGGKAYTRAWDSQFYLDRYPCWGIWDANVASTLKALVGQPVTIKVNRDNADFPKIKSLVTVGGAQPAEPAPSAPSPAAAPSGGSGTAARPVPAAAGSGNSFKRDPLGVMLNLRQTALNCATQWLVSFNEKLPAEEKMGTAQLMKTSEILFRHLVKGVEDSLPIPQSGPETKDNGSATIGQTSDDDIPF